MNASLDDLTDVYKKLPPEERLLLTQFAAFLEQKQSHPVDARTARRTVSDWLVREVGNLLMGGEPEYVAGVRPLWRVPVFVTQGGRRQVDNLDVDAQTGELLP